MAWRLGTVPYLNAEPLTAALRQKETALLVGEAVVLSTHLPAELMERLLAGKLDAALAPTVGVLPQPHLRILPGMCVASHGAVPSFQLYARVPPARVSRTALDGSSRSAAALTRILFRELWGCRPEFLALPPET